MLSGMSCPEVVVEDATTTTTTVAGATTTSTSSTSLTTSTLGTSTTAAGATTTTAAEGTTTTAGGTTTTSSTSTSTSTTTTTSTSTTSTTVVRIVFSSDRDNDEDEYDIYIMDIDGSNIMRLTSTANAMEAVMSADTSKVIYAAGTYPDIVIYEVSADGSSGSPNALTDNDHNVEPDISPDGTKIVYVCAEGSLNTNDREIWIMNADGTGKTALTSNEVADDYPHFSPDGTRIVYQHATGTAWDAVTDIWTMDVDGGNQEALVSSEANDQCPSYASEASGKIIFRSDRDKGAGQGFYDLYSVVILDQTVTRVTTTAAAVNITTPNCSPYGTKIVYGYSSMGTEDICIRDVDGSNRENLTDNAVTNDLEPSF